jgi:signal peptidase I
MFGAHKDWGINNFGPIYVPKKGDVVQLNKETYPFYKWIISRYDDHDAGHQIDKHKVELKGNDVYIDGELTKEYTVKQDYYWMMGDNRSKSEDSRFWGFVPFDHVVGKPVFIFMSIDKETGKIRWDRVFTTVSGKGKRVSYLLPFFGLIVLYYAGKKFIKKNKE